MGTVILHSVRGSYEITTSSTWREKKKMIIELFSLFFPFVFKWVLLLGNESLHFTHLPNTFRANRPAKSTA